MDNNSYFFKVYNSQLEVPVAYIIVLPCNKNDMVTYYLFV